MMLTVFTHFLRRGRQGGVELFLDGLLCGLDGIGAEYHARNWQGPNINRFISEQIDILNSRKANVLLPNYYVPPITHRSTNITVVIHDLLFASHPNSLPPAKIEWLSHTIPIALRRANHVVAISEFTKNEIIRLYGRFIESERVSVIHNPIDLTRFSSGELPSELVGVEYVLSPSSGFWHKNVPILLKAFSKRPELRDLKLVLVGQPPSQLGWSANTSEFREEYQRLVDNGNAIELGYVSDGTLGELYKNSACVAFPSLYEGFGMPIFEALGLGARVVCGRVGAVPDLCSDLVTIIADTSAEDEWVEKIVKSAKLARPTPSITEPMLAQLHPDVVARKYISVST